jgi:histone deacetylase 8
VAVLPKNRILENFIQNIILVSIFLMKDLLLGEEEGDEEEMEECGLIYDCAPYNGLVNDLARLVGASLYCAESLVKGSTVYAIHWDGGRHHAKRDSASGFCHVNDAVLCVQVLQEKFEHVLYIDIDIHHGDGVQEAFYYTDSVTTVSFHLKEPGFFPGTGSRSETGLGRGKGSCFNFPLSRGTGSDKFIKIFTSIIGKIVASKKIEAIVFQCGCDGLALDPLGGWNLDSIVYAKACQFIVSYDIPTLFLGGGGYQSQMAAKCWTLCTLAIADPTLSLDVSSMPEIPDACPNWPNFSPDYSLLVPSLRHMKDELHSKELDYYLSLHLPL